MWEITKSEKIYFGLVILLAVLAAVSVYLPQGGVAAVGDLPAPRIVLALVNMLIMLVIYGGLGFIGLKLADKIGFTNLWDDKINNRERFLIPALIGGAIGVISIIIDAVISNFHQFGPLPHPPFPTSLVASATAGIGEEIIFRLFFISFWIWVISKFIDLGIWRNKIFWLVTIFSALAFTFFHLPSVMYLLDTRALGDIPGPLFIELFIINGLVSFFAAYYFRKYGFLAAVGVHFWTDIVWHVIWGLF